MNTEKFKEFYKEIDKILPSLEYCLAPKKASEKSGAASLRSSAAPSQTYVAKDPAELDKHTKVLYEWLDREEVSRIRMMLNWQAASGLSFVAQVHHRACVCFRYHGNSKHGDCSINAVTLQEFQDSVKCRHAAGGSGICADSHSSDNDYK